jgi:uncharacterized protein YcbX
VYVNIFLPNQPPVERFLINAFLGGLIFMVLTEIHIYPIKSTKGISLQSGLVERRGIQFDRRWMVVDKAGMFLSQRDHPRLALVSTKIVSFADAFPLLLISQASLDDLNSKLAVPVPMNRFRPNIVISGCNTFDEDKWKEIRVGETVFYVIKPCARCVTTTVDQTTGVQGKEPLATLSKYRKVDGQVLFGQNVIPEKRGMLRVGDIVEVIS